MGDVGPKAPVEDVPPFLRRTATPQQQAIENIVSDRSIAEELAGQNKFLQNVVGPFAPPVGSAITPEEIAYFLQNYG
jgi:hypothetical protein